MNTLRTRKSRKENKLARALMLFNISSKSEESISEDFNLGLKIEQGRLESVNEVIRAVSLIKDLASAEVITQELSQEILMNLAQKMTGFKVVG